MTSALLLVASIGCATHAEFVHPDFSSFDVQRIGVFDVENSTVYDLKAVTFGGVLQRMTFGVTKHDLHSLLKGAIEEALLLKNYETVSLGAASSGDGEASASSSLGPVHDAELTCRIVFWRAVTGSLPEMELRFRIEIHNTPEGEPLYAGTFKVSMKDSGRSRNLPRMQDVIRPAVIRAFGDLPMGTVREEAPLTDTDGSPAGDPATGED